MLLLALLCSLSVAGAAWAVSATGFAIDWDVVAGGGGHASSGRYTVNGSAAQPAAGALSGGSYGLTGGFWSGVGAPTPTPTATPTGTVEPPTATPTATPTGSVTPPTSLIYLPILSNSHH
jgi:hypothetical protein